MRYFFGLDLGQASDYSALAILEREGPRTPESVYNCRHLKRWPLGTPYPDIVTDVAGLVSRPEVKGEDEPLLAVDATGVGAPVVDLLRQALDAPAKRRVQVAEVDFQSGRIEHVYAGPRLELFAVQITGGDTVTSDGYLYRVPKRDLVGSAQVALQTGRLKIAPELREVATLTRELQRFKVKINIATGHDSYEAWREGDHDDLVLAVCLALWSASNVHECRVTEGERRWANEWAEYRGR